MCFVHTQQPTLSASWNKDNTLYLKCNTVYLIPLELQLVMWHLKAELTTAQQWQDNQYTPAYNNINVMQRRTSHFALRREICPAFSVPAFSVDPDPVAGYHHGTRWGGQSRIGIHVSRLTGCKHGLQRRLNWRLKNKKISFFYDHSGLAVTLTFDLLTLKSEQFIFIPKCTEVVNLIKFPQAVYTISY